MLRAAVNASALTTGTGDGGWWAVESKFGRGGQVDSVSKKESEEAVGVAAMMAGVRSSVSLAIRWRPRRVVASMGVSRCDTLSHMALLCTNLPGLQLVSRGKVRDVYALPSDPTVLLFVATDRISAFDVVLKNVSFFPHLSVAAHDIDRYGQGIPTKGILLTRIASFWFEKLSPIIPNHVVTTDFAEMPRELTAHRAQLEGRAMLVRKANVVKMEAIVRGYLAGL